MDQPIFIRNTVVKGFGRGSKELGCPTANVDGINHLNIETGIYCGLVQLVIRKQSEIQEESGHKETYENVIQELPYVTPVIGMVCSFGYNPHYGNKEKSLEVHILKNFNFNFYGAELRVLICKKMRDEEKYNSLDDLKQAIANDVKNATNEASKFNHHINNQKYFLDVNISSNNNNIEKKHDDLD